MDLIDKLLEINSLMLALFGIGIFSAIKSLSKEILKKQDAKNREKELTNLELKLFKKAIVAMMHSQIYGICGTHLSEGYVSVDDLDDLSYLFKAYKSLGGNGTGETLYNKVANLPNKKEKK